MLKKMFGLSAIFSLACGCIMPPAAASQASYVETARTGDDTWHMSLDRIEINGDFVRTWFKIDPYIDKDQPRIKTMRTWEMFDCVNKTSATLQWFSYDAKGRVVLSNEIPAEEIAMKPVIPESVSDANLQGACLVRSMRQKSKE